MRFGVDVLRRRYFEVRLKNKCLKVESVLLQTHNPKIDRQVIGYLTLTHTSVTLVTAGLRTANSVVFTFYRILLVQCP